MKSYLLISLFLLSTSIQAEDLADAEVVISEPIQVDGFVTERPATDPELQNLHAEINKQKKEIVLNKVKAKKFQELSKSVEKLSETTEEYIEEKKAAQAQIAEYNAKVKCMQQENPGSDCDKYVRRKRH